MRNTLPWPFSTRYAIDYDVSKEAFLDVWENIQTNRPTMCHTRLVGSASIYHANYRPYETHQGYDDTSG